MGGFIDNVNPSDDAVTRLSQAPDIESMPGELLCPSGHRAHRYLLDLNRDSTAPASRIPVYGCQPCGVAYRYQECTLPPGEEGLPPAPETTETPA